ncbi:cytochrome c oxidase assembly protein [Leucobacter aridicollis]|uniref:cytochrome c oxidase assembly protein n=1 Tax=Leucobacter aridicollis TaxID=283878 RepID=UPI0021077621|nr:cytochrome c oxidase assembly protein [Leucobacter aridicollis]
MNPTNGVAARTLHPSDMLVLDLTRISPLGWLAVVCLLAYLAGAISLWARGRRWSVLGTISFVLGCLAWFAATGLAVNDYAGELITALVFQIITLLVAVPPLLLMGSPGRLLLRATPHRGVGILALRAAIAAQRSRAARVLLHPVVAILVAIIALPGLFFTDAISWVMALPGGHQALLALMLVFGVIGGAPLWALDPLPRKPSFGVRLAGAFLELQIHALFGLVLLKNASGMLSLYSGEPVGWGVSRALDQSLSGSLVWTYGQLPLIIVLIITLSKWRRSDIRGARHRQDAEDEALDAYNAYLAQTAEQAAPGTSRKDPV